MIFPVASLVVALAVIAVLAWWLAVGVPRRLERRAARAAVAVTGPATEPFTLGDHVLEGGPHGAHINGARATEALGGEPCGFCHDLAEVGNPGTCECTRHCGRSWCPRRPRHAHSSGVAA
ncbi:MAG TPA: hypothetical protein VH478_04270 [Trebonia sp.]|nr:hypothetical protein [Trebonia sp.]